MPFPLARVAEGDVQIGAQPERLLELCRTRREPLVLRGAAKEWPATQSWDLAFLGEYFGDRELPVAWSAERVFPGKRGAALPQAEKAPTSVDFRKLPAKEVFRSFDQAPNPYYLSALPLRREPRLLEDIPFFAARSDDFAQLLWVSSPGHVTPTHFDAHPSLFAQIRGSKRFILFAPDAFTALYPFGVDHPQARYSSLLDLTAPDFARYPAARDLAGYEVQVDSGDLLLLPAFWWHAVFSLELSMSASFPLNHQPFERFDEILGYWEALHELLANALPADVPPIMRVYALRLLLFPPEFSQPNAP